MGVRLMSRIQEVCAVAGAGLGYGYYHFFMCHN
jgi:hypothetical protein